MKWRHASSLCLTLALCSCARGVSQVERLVDAGGGGGNAGEDSGLDAMVTPGLDGGGKDAGKPNGKDAGSGKDAGMTSDAGSDAGMTACSPMNMCSSARVIPAVAGDLGSDMQTTSGTRSEWLSVHVSDTEDKWNAGSTINARISLTSNDGSNYDLFVLKPDDSGGNASPPKDCAGTMSASMNATGVDTLAPSWSDEQNFLGQTAGDGLILLIEVRHVSGPCGSWSLTVEGNK